MSQVKVVVLEPGKAPEVRAIDNTVEGIQAVVGGYFEHMPIIYDYTLVMCEDGRPLQMPPNFYLENGTLIVGTVFFTRMCEGEVIEMQPNEIKGMLNAIKHLRRA